MPMNNLKYERFKRDGRYWGRLLGTVMLHTGVTGHSAKLDGDKTPMRGQLFESGQIVIEKGSEWDFGTGAVNTPSMVRASLPHDFFCHITNLRLVPWSVRRKSDADFRRQLKHYQPDYFILNPLRLNRWWRWSGVSLYSQVVARWRDKNE